MVDSILDSTKKSLGLEPDYEAFDVELIMHINTALATLGQLGIGPARGFMIEDNAPVWSDFIGSDIVLNLVKTYVHLSVRLLFDPPATGFVLTSMENRLKELEFRLNVHGEGVRHPWIDPLTTL